MLSSHAANRVLQSPGQPQRRLTAAVRPSLKPLRAAAAPPPATEVGALAAYKASSSSEGLAPCLQLLKQAATDKSVKPELVEGALAYLEQNSAQPASDIDGTWRLVFSTATGNRAFQYIPVQEDFVIKMATKYCALESVVGPFNFIISGNINSWTPSSGAMDFQFTAVDILLFGKKIWRVNPTTNPKTYTFFFKGEGIAAARSSAGGLALLRL